MPGMPGNISKGEILKRLDDAVNGTPGAADMLRYYEENRKIQQWIDKAYWDMTGSWKILKRNAVKGKDDLLHVQSHWFGIDREAPETGKDPKNRPLGKRKQSKTWWRKIHRMDRVFQAGLKQALRLCLYADDTTGNLMEFAGEIEFIPGPPHQMRRVDGKNWAPTFQNGNKIDVYGTRAHKTSNQKNDKTFEIDGGAGTPTLTVKSAVVAQTAKRARVFKPRPVPLKIDSHWVCAGSHFELIACHSPQQISFMIFTPSPPFSRRSGTYGPEATPERIWVTKARETVRGELVVRKSKKQDWMTVRPLDHRMEPSDAKDDHYDDVDED